MTDPQLVLSDVAAATATGACRPLRSYRPSWTRARLDAAPLVPASIRRWDRPRVLQLVVVYRCRRSQPRLDRHFRRWGRGPRPQDLQRLRPGGAGRPVIDHLVIRAI